jgi:hypothetical protein
VEDLIVWKNKEIEGMGDVGGIRVGWGLWWMEVEWGRRILLGCRVNEE